MKEELHKQFELLQNEVGALRYRLGEYRSLFVCDRSRIDLLNRVAAPFFRMLSESLWGDMVLHLSRVTGPETTGRPPSVFQNLTLRRLPALVEESCKVKLQSAVDAAVSAAAFAGQPRNKFYAHTDLEVVKNPEGSGITLGSVDEMQKAIDLAEAALDVAGGHYGFNRGTYFHNLWWGTAEDMVRTLEAGFRALHAEKAAAMKQFIDSPPPPG